MMYIDVDPITPEVLSAMFTRKLFYEGKVVQYVWEHVNCYAKAINIPITLPTIYYNVPRPRKWVTYFTPTKEEFLQIVNEYHNFVLEHGDAELLIVWYPIPDQAHHHFFSAITTKEAFDEAVKWYDLAAKFALDLINEFKPKRFLVVGDHGFVSDLEFGDVRGKKENYHHRESLALTNFAPPPQRPSQVYCWIRKAVET